MVTGGRVARRWALVVAVAMGLLVGGLATLAAGRPVPTSSGTAPTAAPPAESAVGSAMWWRPQTGLSWQIQYAGRVDDSLAVTAYDLDVGVDKALVARLHRAGHRVICYLSAGSWEDWRADRGRFPTSVVGKPLDGWPDERWLDVRERRLLKPIMKARIATCARKGFDAVDPDNVDGYRNDTGFRIRAADQLRYNRMIARLAHQRGLAVGLKNDLGQVRELEPYFDFAVNEQCLQYDECHRLRPFLRHDKPVLHIEYARSRAAAAKVCADPARAGLSTLVKHRRLDAWRRAC